MSLHTFPPDLWHRLCLFLETNETCQVVIHQHQGRVCALELVGIRERVKAGQGDMLPVGDMPVYAVPAPCKTG